MAGLEPATFCLASKHSTTELHPRLAYAFGLNKPVTKAFALLNALTKKFLTV